jgi:UDP-N-acetylmuramyl pentapeptide synthase
VARRRTIRGREYVPGEAFLRDWLLRAGVAVAQLHRRRLRQTTVIGVTGSVGKTSTKELIAAVLEPELRGTKTPGTDNRLGTVGRTILRTRPDHAFSVVEVAAWFPGSVAEVARLIQPSIAVVTAIGDDHLTAFRNREATAGEKGALVEALADGGVAVLNADDPHVHAMADGFRGRVVWFGESPASTLQAVDVSAAWPDRLRFVLRVDGRTIPVRTRLCGRHWLTAVLAAFGVAYALELPLERAAEQVASFESVTARMSQVHVNGVTFIRDDIKAPLWGFDSVLEFLAEARAGRKILVIGTISDYRGSASRTYVRLARRALSVADELAFVGRNAERAARAQADARPGALQLFSTVREAAEHFAATARAGDLIVLKGSILADHLGRIALAQIGNVRCWRTACGKEILCDECRLLRVPGRP